MKVLILNQTFYPDVVATAYHSADVAAELAAQGHNVTALASSRAYDNPAQQFPRRSMWRGVRIERVYTSGLGKGAKWRRLVDFASFLLACTWRLIWMPPQDVVVALTSPPLIAFLGALFVRLKGGQLVYWVMDLNPDQAIAAGILHAGDVRSKILEKMLRFALLTSSSIVVLDRFMLSRVCLRGVDRNRISIIPPWSHQECVSFDSTGRDAFRRKHGLEGKFVVMHAGNHSPCHPLDTLLTAAEELAGDKDVVFCFAGGGSEHRKIAEHSKRNQRINILCLPYAPVEELPGQLCAADLHVVVMGDPYVGIVHPCKVYNILALGTPLLYIGPAESHITDLAAGLAGDDRFYSARHGAVADATAAIQSAKSKERPKRYGSDSDAAVSQSAMLLRLADVIQSFEPGERVSVPEPVGAADGD